MLWAVLKVMLVCVALSGTAVTLGRGLPGGAMVAVAAETTWGGSILSLVDANRGTMVTLATSDTLYQKPVWSPDGRWLASVLRTGDDRFVYVLDFEAAEMHWFSNAVSDDYLDWSPDSRQLAFATSSDDTTGITILEVATGSTRFIDARGARPTALTWSPDGRYLACWLSRRLDQGLGLVEVERGRIERYPVGLTEIYIRTLNWSPDSRQVLFSIDRAGDWDLFALDGSSGRQRNLTRQEGNDFPGDWSPDGEQIAFMSNRDGSLDIYLLETGSGAVRNLTDHPATDYLARWTPDGRQIAFLSNRGGTLALYVMDAQGEQVRLVSRSPDNMTDYAWRPAPG